MNLTTVIKYLQDNRQRTIAIFIAISLVFLLTTLALIYHMKPEKALLPEDIDTSTNSNLNLNPPPNETQQPSIDVPIDDLKVPDANTEESANESAPNTPKPTSPKKSATISTQSRISVNNSNWYLHGANLAWYNWACDFGCGADNGVSNSTNKAIIDKKLSQASDAGIKVIRWWLFPDDAWQISTDGSKKPTGIDPVVYSDIDVALELAEKHDIYYTFVLFSGLSTIPESWMSSSTNRNALAVEIGKLAERYSDNNRIFTWEVVNEPEWDIWNNGYSEKNTVAMVDAIADEIHTHSDAYVTVGSAMLDGLPIWIDSNVDYLDAHWYDYMSEGDWCAYCQSASSIQQKYNTELPIVVGEFYAGSDVDPLQRYKYWYDNGYAGGYSWSLFSEKTYDGMNVDLSSSAQFVKTLTDVGPK